MRRQVKLLQTEKATLQQRVDKMGETLETCVSQAKVVEAEKLKLLAELASQSAVGASPWLWTALSVPVLSLAHSVVAERKDSF